MLGVCWKNRNMTPNIFLTSFFRTNHFSLAKSLCGVLGFRVSTLVGANCHGDFVPYEVVDIVCDQMKSWGTGWEQDMREEGLFRE